MVGLVVVGQQTLVAARFTNGLTVFVELGLQVRLAPRLPAGRSLEVHDFQRFGRHRSERRWLGRDSCEDTRAAFGRLVEQDGLPVVAPGKRLGHELALFELVHRFDAALQCVLQRGHRGG
ncbi:hypothetical protein D9M68_945480 [compost metagenome]